MVKSDKKWVKRGVMEEAIKSILLGVMIAIVFLGRSGYGR